MKIRFAGRLQFIRGMYVPIYVALDIQEAGLSVGVCPIALSNGWDADFWHFACEPKL